MQKNILRAAICLTTILVFLDIRAPLSWGMANRPPFTGSLAQGFKLTSLPGAKGSLDQHREKVALLNFWATLCQPCTKEMPAIQAVYIRDEGFLVLALSVLENLPKIREHIAEHQQTFEALLDLDNHVANQYDVGGLPVSVFIDKTGHARKIVKGGLLTKKSIAKTDGIITEKKIQPLRTKFLNSYS